MPLTDTAIRSAQPAEKPIRLYDGGGLYLEVAPSGGKWWRLKYRIDGKEKRLSLGTYPETGLKLARERRDEARRLLADGTDPSAQRQADKARAKAVRANHFEAVARAWLEHRAGAWTGETRAAIASSLERDVFPKIGARPVHEVKPADVREVVKAIEARGAGDVALRVLQRIASVYRYAVEHNLTETDPTSPLKPAELFKPRRVQHRAAMPEKELPGFPCPAGAAGPGVLRIKKKSPYHSLPFQHTRTVMTAIIQHLQAHKLATHAALPAHLQPGIPADLADLALLDIKTVSALVGLKATAIYAKLAEKDFPEPIRQGARCTRWKAGAIREYLEKLHAAASDEALKQRQQERARKASSAAKARRAAQAAGNAPAPVSGATA